MLVLCIESSNTRGMGHLFRALLFVEYFRENKIDYRLLINDDEKSLAVLNERGIDYTLVDFSDITSNWESDIIEKYNVNVWLNDKFETDYNMGKHISEHKKRVLFCMIDDVGEADQFADIMFAGMIYPTKKIFASKKVYSGSDYIILNPEISKYKRVRNELRKIIVSLGGSDPQGVTLAVIEALSSTFYDVDIVIGPNFKFREELEEFNDNKYNVYQNVPSLIELFSKYDLAITGGGVTCCEANAAGLPCIIIANAPHEVLTGRFMQKLGGSLYAGDYKDWDRGIISRIKQFNINEMSESGMKTFRLDTVERIINIIEQNKKEVY